ncbi:hypothetical protein D3C80_889920 [compost metagenome]
MSAIDGMAETYWNAFRDGFVRVGGDPKQYPTWRQGKDPNTRAVQSETTRCMRHAVEALRDVWGQPFDEVFPDAPVKRSSARTVNDDAMAERVK